MMVFRTLSEAQNRPHPVQLINALSYCPMNVQDIISALKCYVIAVRLLLVVHLP